LVGIEIEFVNSSEREYLLKNSISKIKNKYDFIIIDCPPSLGLLTINALSAANSIIIPIQCEYLALEGLGKLLNTIKSIQKLHNKNLKIEGLLLTMYDVRLNLSNQVKKEVKTHFNEMVFKTVIHRNVKLGEATSFGKSIIDYDVSSKGADNYLNLANELITKN
jgi:chromosome partitioning protein